MEGSPTFWKLKIKRLLVFMDLWNIMDGSKEPPPFNVEPWVLKEYQRRVKMVMSIISLNLVDNQLMHIKSCKNLWRYEKLFVTFTRRRIYPTSSHLPQIFHMQDIKLRRLFGPRQQDQDVCRSTHLFGGTHEGRKHYHDLAQKHTIVVRILDHCHGDDDDKIHYDGLRNNQCCTGML